MLVRAVPSATYVSTLRTTYQRRLLHQLSSTFRAHTTNQLTAYGPLQLPATSQSTTRLSHLSPFSTSTSVMSSDADYMAFLGKANADLKAGQGQQGDNTIKTQTVDSSLSLPASLKNVDAYYVSESDEPFEPVLLRWEDATQGKWPSEDELRNLISPNGEVEISTLSVSSFDPKNQYTTVLDAIRSASGNSDIKIYRAELGSSTVEYFVLALDSAEGGRVIGLRAKSIES